MGLETIARCDVYGTIKDVRRFRIEIIPVDEDGSDVHTDTQEWEVYLGPRGLDRLKNFIERGLARPSDRKPTAMDILKPK